MKMEDKFSKVIWIFDKVLMKQSRLVKKENLTGNRFCNHSFNFVKIEYEYAENGLTFERFDKLRQKTLEHLSVQFSKKSFLPYKSAQSCCFECFCLITEIISHLPYSILRPKPFYYQVQ